MLKPGQAKIMRRNINNVTLSGNTVAVPFYKETEDGNKFVSFRLASNRRAYTDGTTDEGKPRWKQRADFIPVEVVGKSAERFKDLPVGSAVVLTGSLESYNYKNKEGETIYALRVHSSDIISIIPAQKKETEKGAEEEAE